MQSMNFKRNRTTRPRRKAFTLIEVMVATTVMVILVGLVIQITNEVLKVWNRSSGKLSATAEARVALELLTADLETAIFRDNGMQWLRVESPVDVGDDYANQTVALKLFAPALDRPKTDASGNSIPGDVCGIAYRLAYKEAYTSPAGEGPKIYALYRRLVDARLTFNELLGSGNQESLDKTMPKWSANSFGNYADGQITAIEDESNYLATNIVNFKIIIYYLDDSVLPPTAKPYNADPNTLKLKEIDYVYGGNQYTGIDLNPPSQVQPLYADIVLTMITDQGLEMLQNVTEGRLGTGYVDESTMTAEEQIVREHSETFTRRVSFAGRAF